MIVVGENTNGIRLAWPYSGLLASVLCSILEFKLSDQNANQKANQVARMGVLIGRRYCCFTQGAIHYGIKTWRNRSRNYAAIDSETQTTAHSGASRRPQTGDQKNVLRTRRFIWWDLPEALNPVLHSTSAPSIASRDRLHRA